jgi:hypothetical protein
MKKYLNKFFFTAAAATVFFSACKKEETKIYYNGGSNPVLTSSLSDSIILVAVDSLNNVISFSWTNPNYQFTDGISSQDVNYYMEFDTLGANFSSKNMQQVSIGASALDTTFTVGAINSILANGLGLTLGQQHNIQVRLESFLGTGSSGASALYSNVFNYRVTPYAPPPLVSLPSTGTLFLVGGDPLLGAWNNSVPANQQFIMNTSDSTKYSIVITLSGGDPTQASDQFSVTSQDGTWNGQFGVPSANLTSAYSSAGIFNANGVKGSGTNFPGPTAAGTYKIELNFQTGTYTETLQ